MEDICPHSPEGWCCAECLARIIAEEKKSQEEELSRLRQCIVATEESLEKARREIEQLERSHAALQAALDNEITKRRVSYEDDLPWWDDSH